jgi:NTE family protein
MKKDEKGYALVLAGGGAKGVYQIGAWRALRELKIPIVAVVGASVGALNAALIAQNDYDLGLKLWKNMDLNQIIGLPEGFIKEGKLILSKESLVKARKLQLSIFRNRGFDTTPLRELIRKHLDEDKIRKSGIDLGVVTVDIKAMGTREFFLSDIEEGYLGDYLLASATFPGFKRHEINGRKYSDGGILDNVPFGVIKERGYRNIIILDVSGIGLSREPDILGTQTVYIKNTVKIGSTFDFNRDILDKFMELGYLDTLRTFGAISGVSYYFHGEETILPELKKILFGLPDLHKLISSLSGTKKNTLPANPEAAVRQILPKELKLYKDVLLALTECAAQSINIETTGLYDFPGFLSIIFTEYRRVSAAEVRMPENHYTKFFLELPERIQDVSGGKTIFEYSPLEYEKSLEIISGKREAGIRKKMLHAFFPTLVPGLLFFEVLKRYFH